MRCQEKEDRADKETSRDREEDADIIWWLLFIYLFTDSFIIRRLLLQSATGVVPSFIPTAEDVMDLGGMPALPFYLFAVDALSLGSIQDGSHAEHACAHLLD